MKEVILTNGMKTLVDDEDFERVTAYNWGFDCFGYGTCTLSTLNIRLHRFIMNAPKGLVVDHINGDRLDNRKENLRLCSIKENIRNSKKHKDNTSGYRGVSTIGRLWRAYIVVDRKQISLGCYKTREEAALAYNRGATLYHGEYAHLNVIL